MKMKLTITTPSYMNTSSAGLKLPPAWLKSVNAKGIQLLQNRLFVPVTTELALRNCKDAIGVRIVCNFIDDIDRCLTLLRQSDWCDIVKEKDYITNAKPNGYRSYHVILNVTTPYKDVDGNVPGHYYAEIQLRTIAMDSWASLEHEMKYKHHIKNPERIGKELKRCADQLASCDVQMQTIRQLINEHD